MCDGDWVESKDQDPNGDVRLIQLADIGAGSFLDKSDRHLNGDKAQELNCTYLRTGDVLISRLGDPLGKACLFPALHGACVTVVDVHIFRSGCPDLDHTWIVGALNSPQVRRTVQQQSSGTTRTRITGNKLKNLEILVPPANEQRRIASKIHELFSLIDEGERALERVQQLVEHYRQSMLKAAVTGELTRKWREQHKGELESGQTLIQRILKSRRDAWERAELEKMRAKGREPTNDKWKQKYKEPAPPDTTDVPELPEGWAWVSVEQLCFVETGATPKRGNSKYYAGGDIGWITSTAVNASVIRSAPERITTAAIQETNAKIFPIGTLIVAMYGEGKTRGKVSELGIEAATNQACAGLICGHLPAAIRAYLRTVFEKNYMALRSQAAGGVQLNLNLSMIKATLLLLPPAEEIETINGLVSVSMSQVDSLCSELAVLNQQCAALRQRLLARAFNGQLVEQDPSDEAAADLLERINVESHVAGHTSRRNG